MIIREFCLDDRSAIDDMLKACGVFTHEEIEAALQILDEWVPCELDENYSVFVREGEGCVQGYACISKTPLTASSWHLYWICVHPKYQGTGVAQALISHVEAFIGSRSGERLALETSGLPKYERTRRFYQAVGFQQVGRIKDFYKSGDDCLMFCKELER